jgi:hypothetical protein
MLQTWSRTNLYTCRNTRYYVPITEAAPRVHFYLLLLQAPANHQQETKAHPTKRRKTDRPRTYDPKCIYTHTDRRFIQISRMFWNWSSQLTSQTTLPPQATRSFSKVPETGYKLQPTASSWSVTLTSRCFNTKFSNPKAFWLSLQTKLL